MAKAPRPGQVKTRLVPPLTPETAGLLSRSFLRDITENIRLAARTAPLAGYIAYAPAGFETLFAGLLAPGTGLVLADGAGAMPPRVQGFGRALLHAARALFARGHVAVALLNSDSPTLPTTFLSKLGEALNAPGDRVVLGPAEDGGYYVLGMKAPHVHLFEDIAWSTDRVAEETRRRARALRLEVVELATWYDVDDGPSLRRLLREVSSPQVKGAPLPYAAPATAACLARLHLDELRPIAAARR